MNDVCSMLLRLPPLSKMGVHHESIVQNFVHLVSVVVVVVVVVVSTFVKRTISKISH